MNLNDKLRVASGYSSIPAGFRNPQEWHREQTQDGVKNLKRYLIGLCKDEAYKSVDDVITTFERLGMINKKEDGLKLLKEINKKPLTYASGDYSLTLTIQPTDNLNDIVYVKKDIVQLQE